MRERVDQIQALLARYQGHLVFVFASIVTSLVAFAGNIIAARYLTPEKLGVMQTLLLIPTYCMFLPLGVFNGLSRNIAFHLGKQEPSKVQAMVDSSWSVAKIVSLVGALIGAAFIVHFLLNGNSQLYLEGMIFVFLALVVEPFSQHLDVVYTSSQNFRSLGLRTLLQNIVTAIGNLLPIVAGVAGFIGSRCVFILARFFSRWPGVPFKACGRGSIKDTRELAVTGMPLLIAGTLYNYLGVADRSLVAWFMRPEDLGHYTLAVLVVTANQFAPVCLATLLYPGVAACYGRTGSSRALRRHFWLLLGSSVAVLVPTCVLTYCLVDPLTRWYLPKYVEGIPAAKVACLSSLTYIYFGVTSIMAVMRRNVIYIGVMVISLALVWVLGAYFMRQGYGIVGAIWARTIASTLLCVFTLSYGYWLTNSE